MKTKSIHLSNLRVVELLTFLERILPVLNQNAALNAKLKQKVDELVRATQELAAAQSQGSFENETKAVKQAAKRLNESIKLFVKFVDAFTHSDSAATKEQATLILSAVRREMPTLTGGVQKAQPGVVDGLNQLFTTNSRYADSLVALGAKPFWTKVMDEKSSFEGVYSNRTAVKASEEDAESAYEISKTVRPQVKTLLEFLDDLYSVEEKLEYADMIGKINVEIDAVMAVIHTRETLAEKAKKEKEQNRSQE